MFRLVPDQPCKTFFLHEKMRVVPNTIRPDPDISACIDLASANKICLFYDIEPSLKTVCCFQYKCIIIITCGKNAVNPDFLFLTGDLSTENEKRNRKSDSFSLAVPDRACYRKILRFARIRTDMPALQPSSFPHLLRAGFSSRYGQERPTEKGTAKAVSFPWLPLTGLAIAKFFASLEYELTCPRSGPPPFRTCSARASVLAMVKNDQQKRERFLPLSFLLAAPDRLELTTLRLTAECSTD